MTDESSDDEPLINLVKKKSRAGKQTKTKTKASAPKKKNMVSRPSQNKKTRKTSEPGDTDTNLEFGKRMPALIPNVDPSLPMLVYPIVAPVS